MALNDIECYCRNIEEVDAHRNRSKVIFNKLNNSKTCALNVLTDSLQKDGINEAICHIEGKIVSVRLAKDEVSKTLRPEYLDIFKRIWTDSTLMAKIQRKSEDRTDPNMLVALVQTIMDELLQSKPKKATLKIGIYRSKGNSDEPPLLSEDLTNLVSTYLSCNEEITNIRKEGKDILRELNEKKESSAKAVTATLKQMPPGKICRVNARVHGDMKSYFVRVAQQKRTKRKKLLAKDTKDFLLAHLTPIFDTCNTTADFCDKVASLDFGLNLFDLFSTYVVEKTEQVTTYTDVIKLDKISEI